MKNLFTSGTVLLLLCSIGLSQEYNSVHKQHSIEYRQKTNNVISSDNSENKIIPLQPKQPKLLSKAVFGFLPDWEYASATNIHYDLLTHLAAFDFPASSSGSISNPSGWPWTSIINTAHANGVKVIMCVTNFNASDIHTLLTNTTSKNNLFNNIKTKIQTYNLDGVNMDLEGPNTSDRGSLMNSFMLELTNYIHTNLPGKEVSFDGPVVNWSGWDFVGLANSCDYIFIMGYDFYGSWSTTSGPSSPLTGGTYNISNALTSTSWGYGNVISTHPEKLILGIPYYGNHWTTQTSEANSTVISYISSTRFKDDYVNAQIYGRIWQSNYQVPWYRYQESSTWHQKWYDDDVSIGLKYDLAVQKNLKGVGMWALNYDGSRQELWNLIRNKFYYDVPVELASFKAEQTASNVLLSWATASETNNLGFEIQRGTPISNLRDLPDIKWEKIGFVFGKGSTTEKQFYSYTDNLSNYNFERVYYRLKQTDSNGSFDFSEIIMVALKPFKYSLSQNFPNPFNPSTKINFQLPENQFVKLTVYDLMGKEITTLVASELEAGFHSVQFNPAGIASGVYIYCLQAGKFKEIKKMSIVR